MTQQERIYNIATELTQGRRAIDLKHAMELFESIPEYKDASSCAEACKKRLELLEKYDVYKQEQTSRKTIGWIVCIAMCVLVLCIAVGNIVASFFGGEKNTRGTPIPVPTSSPGVVPTTKVVVTSSPRPTPTKVPVATPVPTPVPTPMTPSILPADVSIGGIVQFGAYEQDDVLSNGYEAIDWIVLDRQDGKALLISRYGLCATNGCFITWENSDQRTWLNDDFYNMSFSPAQQQNICTTTVHTPDNPKTGTPGGNDTEDKIFILSVEEVEKYFSNNTGWKAPATLYMQGLYAPVINGSTPWILRNPGDQSGYAASIGSGGWLVTDLTAEHKTMRPAMWVKFESVSTPTPDPMSMVPSLSCNITVGDIVKYGAYEQDNNQANGNEAIEWLVLDKQDGKAFLISKYCLDSRRYNPDTFITWENCELRKWLNTEFYHCAFSEIQRQNILTTTVHTPDTPTQWDPIDGGNDTLDKLFLLSVDEANQYFTDGRARRTVATANAAAKGARVEKNNSYWWLRSPGSESYYASSVNNAGTVDSIGRAVGAYGVAVRPAMWVTLDSGGES